MAVIFMILHNFTVIPRAHTVRSKVRRMRPRIDHALASARDGYSDFGTNDSGRTPHVIANHLSATRTT